VIVVDASALVDLLLADARGRLVADRLHGEELHAPAHVDAEVLSALGRLERAGMIPPRVVASRLRELAAAPIRRHSLAELLTGAWRRRNTLRLVDGLYVALATSLGTKLVTTDRRLARATQLAELIDDA